jgi:phosphoglycolate phosphatase-like HAD superfamily hydrolase
LVHPERGLLDEFKTFVKGYNNLINTKGVQGMYDALNLPCDMNDLSHPVWIAYNQYKSDHPAQLYPGIKEAIQEIWELGTLTNSQGRNHRVRLAINTTNSWSSIYKELLAAGILHCFDSYITAEVLNRYNGPDAPGTINKPSKISVALCLNILDTDGGATFHVGDTLADLQASIDVMASSKSYKGESLITIGAAWGYEGRESLERGVKTDGGTVHFRHIADTPDELPRIIEDYL